MVTLAESLVSSTSRPLLLRMRPDLSARRHRYHGRTFWVVKEPVGLNYFRFHEEEYAILGMLDGRTSLEEIKEQFEQQFAPQKITYSDLLQFVGMLHRSGLVISEAAGQGKQLVKRANDKNWRELMGKLSNVFALRFRGVDPERFLNWLYKYTGWFFRWPTVVMVMMFGLCALSLVMVQFSVFQSRLPNFHEFFGPRNWFYLAITMAVVKVLHEFGHGLSCKHFGGECHELGAMMLVFTPALYCNVSDSWMLPNKWHRAAIGAAGMYVELFLASCATFVWWFSEPGLLNHISLSIMFICSVSTVIFNGNPLLRFDGYYILMDLLEIPNLRQKSTEITRRVLLEYCLGIEQPENPFLPQGNKWPFAVFTIAAVIYRWVVVFSIMFFLNKVFEPYGLKIIGQVMALSGLVGLVIQPLWELGKFFYTPGRMNKVKSQRVTITLSSVAVVLALFFLVPLPHSVKCVFEVKGHKSQQVVANVVGQIREIKAKPGDRVKAGDVLLVLHNLQLEDQLEEAEGRVNEAEIVLRNLLRLQFSDSEAIKQIEPQEKILITAKELLAEKQAEFDRLTVRAPCDGVVLALPHRSAPAQNKGDGRLPTWTGSPFSTKNIGAQLEPTDPICLVGDPEDLEAMLLIDQTYYSLVREGQAVKLLFDSKTGSSYKSKITLMAGKQLDVANPTLSTKAGGRLDTVTDKSGMLRPLSTTYPAIAPIGAAAGSVPIGLQGQARVYTDWQTLFARVARYVAKTFHFDL